MRKLAIVLGSIVLLFGAACAGNSDKSDDWSASQKAELRRGLVQGYETVGRTPSGRMADCMTEFVTEHYDYNEVLTMNSEDAVQVGFDTAMFCRKQNING